MAATIEAIDMPDNIVFYVVFIGQVFLISYYFPRKILGRIEYVIETYPPSKYPKLYPKPVEYYEKAQRNYRIMNQLILAFGFVLMFAYGLLSTEYDAKQKHAEGMPVFFGMIQFFPFILMEIFGFKHFKLMRKADSRTSRQAELRPRRVFDFVSPAVFGMAVFLYIAYVLVEFYIPQFQFRWDSDAIVRVCSITVCNLLFVGIILWNLYGKRINPYQAHKDRIRQIEFVVKSSVFTSIAVSIYLIVTIAMKEFDLEYLEIVVNSLYLQLLTVIGIGTMLRKIRIEDTDFDVYKEDVSVT